MLLDINIIKEYFLLDIYDYFDGALHFYINIFVLLLGVAICVFCFVVTAYTRHTYAVYTQLLRHKAFDEANAKTIDELHLKPTSIIKNTLMRGNHFNKCIRRVGENSEINGTKAPIPKIDFSTEKFYIDTSVKVKNTEPPTYTSAIITSVIFVFVSVLLFLFMPDILALLSGYDMFNPSL